MNFNDKFLNVCFAIGKTVFSVLLLLALIVTIILWVNLGLNYLHSTDQKLSYKYNADEIVYNIYANDFGIKKATKPAQVEKQSKEKEKAFEIFEKFIDENKLPANLKNNVNMPNDDSQKVPFMKNFPEFYQNFKLAFITIVKENTKFNETQIAKIMDENKVNIYKDAMQAYSNAFADEARLADIKKQEATVKKQALLISAIISLTLFVLFLFLPILIRIEENTRK